MKRKRLKHKEQIEKIKSPVFSRASISSLLIFSQSSLACFLTFFGLASLGNRTS